MSDREGFTARIVEVFQMRLGGEVLIDVTLEVAGDADSTPTPPRPDDTMLLHRDGRPDAELPIWSVPLIPHPEGSRRLNVQFRPEELDGVMPVEGQSVTVVPND
jgi:hypothetical protein